jgi:uncharacterized membrane protein (GlpM family)
MADTKKLGAIAGLIALFVALVVTVILLAVTKKITGTFAMLALIALLGMYVGFGFLIAVYRFVEKLK